MRSVLPAIILLGLLIKGTQGLRCYGCDSCDKPTKDFECDPGRNSCIKMGKEGAFMRGCGIGGSADTCQDMGPVGTACTCPTDLCNGTPLNTRTTSIAACTFIMLALCKI